MLIFSGTAGCSQSQSNQTYPANPVIPADVPDPSVIRVGDVYYMSSTTMHMNPGIPIMKSDDLVNWRIVNYVYATLDDSDAHTLSKGKNEYGRGSWASSLRHHNRQFYVVSFSYTTQKTYIFRTGDIETGPWERFTLDGIYHDPSLFFDENRVFLVYGVDDIRITEFTADATSLKVNGVDQVLIAEAKNIAGTQFYVPAEGAHVQKIGGYYYVSLISWPAGGMRTQLVYRSDSLLGTYTGRIVLQDDGIAQGGFIDTADGVWYAFLFKDSGSLGRVPVLVPVKWEDNWPVLGIDGKVPRILSPQVLSHRNPGAGHQSDENPATGKTAQKNIRTGPGQPRNVIPAGISGIVASDEFDGSTAPGHYNDATSILAGLPLVWQWNHNPDPDYWSLEERPGYLRLTNGELDSGFTQTRNTLTQRTFGPQCTGTVKMDVSRMKNGDVAGLGALQGMYGFVGVKMVEGRRFLTMVRKDDDDMVEVEVVKNAQREREMESIPLDRDDVYLRIAFDFTDQIDEARFYYSLDGLTWTGIGETLQMRYTLDHFMGYRFALFNYATEQTGGHVDFDYYRVQSGIAGSGD